jgi:predicted molibdopterin-dependent oxidoreductase YjgC
MSKAPQRGPTVSLSVDGERITAPAGATAAAAMLGAGKRAWRTTRVEGKPRGQFCGIGACWDCLVSVDGSQVQRACLLPVEEGMRISTEDPELNRPCPEKTTRSGSAGSDTVGGDGTGAGQEGPR